MYSSSNPPSYIPIVNQPFLYIVGFSISNNAVTPNSLLNVGVGQCRDSTDTYDIDVGASLVINSAHNGLNGLDTGTIADNKIYAVIVVYDPVNGNPTGAMITLTPTAPLLPFGYSAYRVIGYVATNGSANFYLGQWTAGGTGNRTFVYDLPVQLVNAGSATSFAAVDLSTVVPNNIAEIPVSIYYGLVPNAAGNTLTLQGVNRSSSGYGNIITAVSTNHQTGITTIIAELNASSSNKTEINYKVTASATVNIYVAGYTINL